jgi:NitT/TauT family transport system substrate-binding protein
MSTQHARQISRRRFLGGLTLVGAAGLLGLHPKPAAAEPPPETTQLKLYKYESICVAPQYIAEELLKAEGFTEVTYVPVTTTDIAPALACGVIDISLTMAANLVIQIDRGDPVTVLAGVHVGCFELFGTERVRAIRDLQGKTVAVTGLGLTPHVFLASMVAYVGLDPRKDVNFVAYPSTEAKRLLAEGKVDAYLGFPPDPQELRERKIGHVVVNSAVDRPWSQYFCCMAVANRGFVQKHPVATKRALRALLKAANLCALEPERVAEMLVDGGFTARRDWAQQSVTAIPYNRWRELSPEDTVRFYALRLHEVGMIKSTPKNIVAQGTDWHFLTELKQELKG